MMYEEIEHTADLAIRVVSSNLSELLGEAARAVLALSGIEVNERLAQEESITLIEEDPESLLVGWLEELLFSIEVKNIAFTDCHITIEDGRRLHAAIKSSPISSIKRLIKAVTFHALSIDQVEDGLETVIVFDV